jgi:nitroimidazol reductase NimA-like FMN-containing flavoprotein (pyridoxamine 5'-phosphate oxidase superfamily)
MALGVVRSMPHAGNMWANEFSDVTTLTQAECFDLLSQVSLGRIALSIHALPVILPVQFVLADHSILFAAVVGSTLDVATTGTVVAFQTDAQEPLGGNYWSVLVQGIASSGGDGQITQESAAPLKPRAVPPRQSHTVRIEPSIVSGRRFRIAGDGPSAEFPDAPSL